MLSGPPLSSLSQLLKSPHALQVLKELQNQAEEVKVRAKPDRLNCLIFSYVRADGNKLIPQDMIRDEMEKEYGWSWGVQAGFHAVSVEKSSMTPRGRDLYKLVVCRSNRCGTSTCMSYRPTSSPPS